MKIDQNKKKIIIKMIITRIHKQEQYPFSKKKQTSKHTLNNQNQQNNL